MAIRRSFSVILLSLATLSLGAADCNENGSEDADDIAMAVSDDCDQDGVPDECQRPPLRFVMRLDVQALRVGSLPTDFAVGDLDGDRGPDVVTANQDDTVSVLLHRGGERFELVTEKASGSGVSLVHLVDLNDDGHREIVTAGDETISVFLGDGTGQFADARLTTGLGDLRALAVSDLDGNGTQDLAAPDRRGHSVVTLLGRGDGTFEDAQHFASGGRPTGLVAVDLDGDGLDELVTGNDQTRDVTVLRNLGGTFGKPVPYSTNGRPGHMTVVPGPGGAPELFVVVGARVGRLRGLGDGTFADLEMVYEATNRIVAFASVDLDGDETRDLLFAPSGSSTVRIVRGRRDGGFGAEERIGVDGFARQVKARDLDGDGDREILTISQLAGVTMLWQDSTGLLPFETTAVAAVIQRPHSATSGDFSGDGFEDVVTSNGSDDGVTVFLSQGDGNLAEGVTVLTPGYLNSIAAVDLEGDGDLDVLCVDPKDNLLFALDNTDGQGAMGNLRSYPAAGREPFMVTTGDMDDDGDPDAVVANASDANLSILFNDGAGAFLTSSNVPAGSRPVAVAVGDLNGDGHLDVAASNSSSAETLVFLGNGGATFGASVSYPSPGRTLYVAVADLDGDGDLELVSANENTDDHVSVLLNAGDGRFDPGGLFDSGQNPYSLITSDLDGDGRIDVATANQGPNSVSVLQGAGDGSFSGLAVYPVGQDPRFVMALDLDADGDRDLVSANHTSRDLTVLLHRSAELKFQGDYLERICSAADFEAVSVAGRAPVDRAAKYILPVSDDPDLLPPLFQNVSRFPLHQEFLTAVFPDRFPALPPQEYNQLVGRRATRRYFAGVLSRLQRPQGVAYGFNVVTDVSDDGELLELEDVRGVFGALSEVFRLEPLGYFPDTLAARDAASGWSDPGFPVYFEEEGEEVAYEAYTIAVGYGRVRLLDADGFAAANENGEASFQSILVLEEAPRDIEGVVGGVITAQRQGELSHVAIRTARRGTPNAYVADAAAVFAPYEGKLVRLEVRAAAFLVEEVPLKEAEAFWADNRPTLSEVPSLDTDFAELSSLAEIAAMDLATPQEVRFGGKATNLARLGRIFGGSEFERFREVGFSIPVRYYLEFLRANRMPSDLDPNREVTYEEYLSELLASPEFQTDSRLRLVKLEEFRERARDEGVVDESLVQRLLARVAEVFLTTGTPVRFRSSSNVEDALEFNGAGLYESTGGCADDDLDDDDEGPSRCDPSKMSERGIRRALKKVWTSIYTFRAFEERAFYGIPEELVAMGILVSRAFPDELANGVAFTGNLSNPLDRRFVVTVQLGEESVVHPDPGVLPEKDILEVSGGQVLRIIRPLVGSTLVDPGTWILSDAQLEEMGAVLAFVDENFPVDLGPPGPEQYRREQVLLDLEFKVEPDNTLAFKQVRPFLLTEAPPPTPEFELVVPEDLSICGVFAVAGAGRGPQEEYSLKSQVHLRGGRVTLPTSADSFEVDLIESVVFGRQREVLEAVQPGRFRVQRVPRADGATTYRFNYEQPFRLQNGSVVEFRGGVPLAFLARDGEALSGPLELDEQFFTELVGREALQATLDQEPLLHYGSCEYESLARWEISVEAEDGTTLRLEERFVEAEGLNDTAPATLVSAVVELAGETRVVTDYFDLVYSAFRHNTGVRYWVVLEPPVEVAGLPAPVHVVEYGAAEPSQGVEAAVTYRDAALQVMATPTVRTAGRRHLTEPGATPFRRGDVNADGAINITDGVNILEYIFRRGDVPTCFASADVDASGRVNLLDAIVLLRFITQPGAPTPVPPFEACAVDVGPAGLSCDRFAACADDA